MPSLTPRTCRANAVQVRDISRDLNGGTLGYPSDQDMTRHEDRVPHADTRFNFNPLNPTACSERTYSKMYEPKYRLPRLRPCAES